MRLFIAIIFNQEVKDHLFHIVSELKNSSIKGSFVDYNNLHLTLSFLGELPTAKKVMEAMDQTINKGNLKEFTLTIKDLGRFKRREGDILWVGIEHNEDLYYLQKCLTKELLECGLEVEDREYRPHLTLARKAVMQIGFDMNEFGNQIPSINQKVDKISLMKSERIHGELVYTEIYSVYQC